MRTYLDCIPCFLQQTLGAVRRLTDDERVHAELMREVLAAATELDHRQPPPVMGQQIHRRIRALTGERDPYREPKQRFTQFALKQLSRLRTRVAESADPLETAVRLAIAGNIIDLGVNNGLLESHVSEAVTRALGAPLSGDIAGLADAVHAADHILFLADNAGEMVFDRLLLEQLPLARVTVAVRGAPVINDATLEDAREAGLSGAVELIDNGSDAPGTVLPDCSPAFRRRFEQADLVIAKGQGNFETLSHVDKDIFFALLVKCPVIARELACEVGTLVLRRSNHSDTAVADRSACA